MMNKYYSPGIVILSLIFFFFFSCSPQPIEVGNNNRSGNAAEPEWYPRPAYNDLYYQGVGTAPFTTDIQTTIDIAKQNALSDLTGQIAVSIRSTMSDSVFESSGYTGELFTKTIKTEVEQKNVADIEVVDTWIKQPYNEAWVYVRLKKKNFIASQNSRNQLVKDNIVQYLDDGTLQYQSDNYGLALKSFLNAYYYSRYIIGNAYIIEYPRYTGDSINVNTLIADKINTIIHEVKIEANSIPLSLKSYDEKGVPLGIRVVTKIPSRGIYPLENVPLAFTCQAKNTQINPIIFTGRNGFAENLVRLSGVYLDTLMLDVILDLNAMNINRDPLIENGISVNLSKAFPLSPTYFRIAVTPVKIFITGNERIDGTEVREPEKFVTRSITQTLTDRGGFSLVENENDAELFLKVDVECSYQNSSMDIINYTAYISVDLYKNSFNNKVHTATFPPVDGFGLDRRQSGILTLEKAGIAIKESFAEKIVQDIIKIL